MLDRSTVFPPVSYLLKFARKLVAVSVAVLCGRRSMQSLTAAWSHGLTAGTGGGRDVDAAADYDELDVEGQLTDLRLITSFLENELNALRQENADFRRHLLATSRTQCD